LKGRNRKPKNQNCNRTPSDIGKGLGKGESVEEKVHRTREIRLGPQEHIVRGVLESECVAAI